MLLLADTHMVLTLYWKRKLGSETLLVCVQIACNCSGCFFLESTSRRGRNVIVGLAKYMLHCSRVVLGATCEFCPHFACV